MDPYITQNRIRGRVWGVLLAAVICLALVAGCAAKPSPPPGNDVIETTAPAVTENPVTDNETTGVVRGLPGTREERLIIGLLEPDNINLNPFASGERLFPVDPSGYYQPIYETLVRYDPSVMDYEMLMAQRVRVRDDRIEIGFRQNDKWHDGSAFVSGDVLFSLRAHEMLKTPAGLLFEAFVTEISTPDNFSLVIQFDETQINAGMRCLEVLAHTLIVPEHIWAPVLSDASTLEQLEEEPIPVIGSGPWSLVYRDEFSFSFKQFEEVNSNENTPQYLTVLNYHEPYLASYAILNNDIDVLLGSSMLDEVASLEPLLPLEGDILELKRIAAGEKLIGITINPDGNDILQRKSLRRLLCLSADTKTSGPLLMPGSPAIGLTDVLTIPSVMSKLNRKLLEAELLTRDDEAVDRLISESGLTLNPATGWIELNGKSIDALSLIFPEGSEHVEKACNAFAESSKELGVPIFLKRVSEDVWAKAYRNGDYELIYTETSINESIAAISSRLSLIPGVGVPLSGLSKDRFNGEEGMRLITGLVDESSVKEKIALFEGLSVWTIREGIFVPLAGGDVDSALWNPQAFPSLDFRSFISLNVHIGTFDFIE
ncbi:MAG: hypothetical protein GX850_05215 [Clostridiaceae bacterium]|nr:hypothetical protein [Clostridiaceae bacterium]